MSELKPLNTSEKRQSNIELLRIIIMFIVVTSHFSVHGGFTFSTDVILGNKLWTQYIRTFVKICMSVLVLISGYFLVDSEKLKVSKVLKMWLQIFTYSIVIFLIYVATGAAPFSIKALAAKIFPINSNQWWFASSYFVMYLLHPFINRFLHSLDKASYQKFIVLGVVCWSVIPTILINKFQSNDLIWFILVYCIGGYLKLHFDITKISSKKAFLIFFILHALTFSSVILFDLIGTKIPTFGGNRHALYFFGMQKLPALLMAVFIFLGFINLKIKYNKFINLLSPAMFGVYLIHDDNYLRSFFWKTLFKCSSHQFSKLFIPYSIGVIVSVFVICTVIEMARIHLIENRYMKSIKKASAYIEAKIGKFFDLKIFKSL